MEAARFTKTLVSTIVTMWYNDPEDYHKVVEKLENRKLIDQYSGMQTVDSVVKQCVTRIELHRTLQTYFECAASCVV
jgi:hypothetical protein